MQHNRLIRNLIDIQGYFELNPLWNLFFLIVHLLYNLKSVRNLNQIVQMKKQNEQILNSLLWFYDSASKIIRRERGTSPLKLLRKWFERVKWAK